VEELGEAEVFEEGVWSSLSATSRGRAVGRGITRVALRFVDEDRGDDNMCSGGRGIGTRDDATVFSARGGEESA